MLFRSALVQAVERALRCTGTAIDRFFFDAYARDLPADYGAGWEEARSALATFPVIGDRAHPFWSGAPCSMLIDEVEAIWSAIDRDDDWALLHAKVAQIRAMGSALA